MIALRRIADNRIMNDRTGADWRKIKVDKQGTTKIEQYNALKEKLETLPEQEATQRKNAQRALDALQAQWDQWLLNRKKICAKYAGGVATDYAIVFVPPEEEQMFLTARYIEYVDENTLTFDLRPMYTVEGSKIVCTKGWVCRDECLLEDDVTDFSALNLEEPMYFQLWFTQNVATREISVQLLVRSEDQDFSNFPENLTKLGREPICEGRVNIDHTITLGRF